MKLRRLLGICLISILFILSALSITGCKGDIAQQEQKANEAFKLAQIQYKPSTEPKKESFVEQGIRNNAEIAFQKYQEILRNSPQSDHVPAALFNMAQIRDTFGPAKEAIPYWLRLIYDFPDSEYFEQADQKIKHVENKWLAAAKNHVYRERFVEAVYLYKQILKINPYNAEAHFALGDAYAKSGRYDEAISEYQIAIDIDRNYLEAQYLLGMIYLAKKQGENALRQFELVIEIKPETVAAYYNMALIYEEMLDDKMKAKEMWRTYIKKAEKNDKEKKWLPTAKYHLNRL